MVCADSLTVEVLSKLIEASLHVSEHTLVLIVKLVGHVFHIVADWEENAHLVEEEIFVREQ